VFTDNLPAGDSFSSCHRFSHKSNFLELQIYDLLTREPLTFDMDSPSDTHSPSKMSQTYSFGDWRIPSPGSYTVLGPSQSGKSELLIKLLKNPSVWREKPSIVIYAAPTLEDRKDYLLRMKEACLKADGEKSEFMAMSQVPDEERVKQLINFREYRSSLFWTIFFPFLISITSKRPLNWELKDVTIAKLLYSCAFKTLFHKDIQKWSL
jgi:hypothetical protein